MPRRRSRIAVLVAVVMVIMLYRVFQNSEWDSMGYTGVKPKIPTTHKGTRPPNDAANKPAPVEKPIGGEDHGHAADPLPPPKEAVKIPTLKTTLEEHGAFGLPTAVATTKARWDDEEKDKVMVTTQPLAPVTTAKPEVGEGGAKGQKQPGHLDGEIIPTLVTKTTSVQHWMKLPEQFPVAEESTITLPTGKPKSIPKVQFDFAPESEAAKEKREKRLEEVKNEMKRAWGGYRKFAWMHDELSPVTGRFRDPFCGWAASLVDGLDTLWIMGMKEEFDEAAKAVKNIDFTFTDKRREIPVFETIIRYLGGLTSAYDISGGAKGNYPMLLEKALELAEILMGVFDTPNRMPILYYNMMPEYASQPHRAGTVSVAELGSMSMEFTRLAQLTGKQKYYDAIARITNALEDFQKRGTKLDGLFPESIDASGCNKTATQLLNAAEAERKAKEAAAIAEEESRAAASNADTDETENRWQDAYTPAVEEPELKRGNGSEPPILETETGGVARRAVRVEGNPHSSGSKSTSKRYDSQSSDFSCVEQGLTSSGNGYESFSMGGSQDSTYEYFPKQYLLLGGLEPKYKTLHINTIEAVKKWLLYRPMVPNDRDILFSAKASTQGIPATDLRRDYEVTHLTCFIGGMFGLGGKIFDRPDDVELAKKLTDGCVWAYESMPSGIMPEGASVVPCQSMKSCPWNETLWWEFLDPQASWREKQILEWEETEHQRVEDQKKLKLKEAERVETEKKLAKEEAERLKAEALNPPAPKEEKDVEDEGKTEVPVDEPREKPAQKKTGDYPRPEPGNNSTSEEEDTHLHAKRGPLPPPLDAGGQKHDGQIGGTGDLKNKLDLNHAGNDTDDTASVSAEEPKEPSGGIVSQVTVGDLPMAAKPQTHEEFVKAKIEDYKIPPGFVTIPYKRYILRPEAIESVWYMYRITGDPTWQEKGWKMWEAIMKATRTEHGHSAIDDILDRKPVQVDEMESFWLAETLKYFYLLYATPDVISLDEWVLNTEAHPFRRPV